LSGWSAADAAIAKRIKNMEERMMVKHREAGRRKEKKGNRESRESSRNREAMEIGLTWAEKFAGNL